jgi:hypothetical protein
MERAFRLIRFLADQFKIDWQAIGMGPSGSCNTLFILKWKPTSASWCTLRRRSGIKDRTQAGAYLSEAAPWCESETSRFRGNCILTTHR